MHLPLSRSGTFVPGDDTFSVDEDTKELLCSVNDTNPGVTVCRHRPGGGDGCLVTIAADRRSLRYTPDGEFQGGGIHVLGPERGRRDPYGHDQNGGGCTAMIRLLRATLVRRLSKHCRQRTEIFVKRHTFTDEGDVTLTSISAGNHGGTSSSGPTATRSSTPAIDFVGVRPLPIRLAIARGPTYATATGSITVSGVAATETHSVEEGNGPFELDVFKERYHWSSAG